MMKLKEIQTVAAGLGNQLGAGVTMMAACQRMARFQPGYAEFWDEAAAGVASGRPVSEFLEKVWPEAVVSAVRAGEESGSLPAVLERIEVIIELQLEMYKMIGELAYPVGFGLLGIGVFVFFMVEVIPALSSSLGTGQHGFVFELSTWMKNAVEQHWMGIAAAVVGAIGGTGYWLSSYENRSRLTNSILRIPVLGEALKSLVFSVWANYMALIDSAGSIPITEGLIITSKTLPASLRVGLEQLAAEAVSRGLADAADPDKQPLGDSRREWPFYVSNAFLIAEETGRLDVALERASKAMLKEGTARLKIALKVANVVALFVSAVLIVGPLAAYYTQLGISLADAMKG